MDKPMEFRFLNDEEREEQDRLDDINLPKPKYAMSNPPKHAGLFFRGFNKVFWDGSQYTQKRGYRLLKRKSCKGCPVCDFVLKRVAIGRC